MFKVILATLENQCLGLECEHEMGPCLLGMGSLASGTEKLSDVRGHRSADSPSTNHTAPGSKRCREHGDVPLRAWPLLDPCRAAPPPPYAGVGCRLHAVNAGGKINHQPSRLNSSIPPLHNPSPHQPLQWHPKQSLRRPSCRPTLPTSGRHARGPSRRAPTGCTSTSCRWSTTQQQSIQPSHTRALTPPRPPRLPGMATSSPTSPSARPWWPRSAPTSTARPSTTARAPLTAI